MSISNPSSSTVSFHLSLLNATSLFSIAEKKTKKNTTKKKEYTLAPPKTQYSIKWFHYSVHETNVVEASHAPTIGYSCAFEMKKSKDLYEEIYNSYVEVQVEDVTEQKVTIGHVRIGVIELLNSQSMKKEYPIVLTEEVSNNMVDETEKYEPTLNIELHYNILDENQNSTPELLYTESDKLEYTEVDVNISCYGVSEDHHKVNLVVPGDENQKKIELNFNKEKLSSSRIKEIIKDAKLSGDSINSFVNLNRKFILSKQDVELWKNKNQIDLSFGAESDCTISLAHFHKCNTKRIVYTSPSKPYFHVEILLDKPFTPKKERTLLNLSELIPSIQPVKANILPDALAEFRGAVRKIVSQLYTEYKSQQISQEFKASSDFKTSFYFYLNSTGIYNHFRERLKGPIAKVLKEKLHLSAAYDKEKKQAARESVIKGEKKDKRNNVQIPDCVAPSDASALYLLLTNEMHRCINSLFDTEIMDDVAKTTAASHAAKQTASQNANQAQKLMNLASESQIVGLPMHYATALYEDALVLAPTSDNWLEYAKFNARQKNFELSITCIKECLSKARSNKQALLLYIAITLELKNLDISETLLSTAPNSFEFSMFKGLLALTHEEDDDADRHFEEAISGFESDQFKTVWLYMASYCNDLKLNLASQFIDRENECLARRIESSRVTFHRDGDALDWSTYLVLETPTSELLYKVIGTIYYSLGNLANAKICYEKQLDFYPQTSDLPTWYNLGRIHLAESSNEDAKDVYLRGAKLFKDNNNESSSLWLGAGIASIKLSHFEDAEKALSQANVIDNKNPLIWSYLCLLCTLQGRYSESVACLEEVMKLELLDAEIWLELGKSYQSAGKFAEAELCFIRSRSIKDSDLVAKLIKQNNEYQHLNDKEANVIKSARGKPNHTISI